MPPSPTSPRVRERLLEALGPVVAAAGYDLEDVRVSSAGRRSLVRVVVDSDRGVDLDAVADVSRAVSSALDDDGPAGTIFSGPFVLEVTSPGVDRPLTEARHWRRAAGRLVKVEVDGTLLTARVVAVEGAEVVLDVEGSRRSVPLAALGPGRVQVEFGRATADDAVADDDLTDYGTDDLADEDPVDADDEDTDDTDDDTEGR